MLSAATFYTAEADLLLKQLSYRTSSGLCDLNSIQKPHPMQFANCIRLCDFNVAFKIHSEMLAIRAIMFMPHRAINLLIFFRILIIR